MNAWLEIIIVWLLLDICIIGGVWFAVNFIKPRYPEMWKRVIVDREPNYYK